MKVIGFNFNKILAERPVDFKKNKRINTDIEFTNVTKDSVELIKNTEILKISFKYSISYMNQEKKENTSQISLEGIIIFSASKEESNNILKSWKKKELPSEFKISLFNLILQKSTAKALQLEEDVNLPAHIPLPRINPKAD